MGSVPVPSRRRLQPDAYGQIPKTPHHAPARRPHQAQGLPRVVSGSTTAGPSCEGGWGHLEVEQADAGAGVPPEGREVQGRRVLLELPGHAVGREYVQAALHAGVSPGLQEGQDDLRVAMPHRQVQGRVPHGVGGVNGAAQAQTGVSRGYWAWPHRSRVAGALTWCLGSSSKRCRI